jgi:hypothetical protein
MKKLYATGGKLQKDLNPPIVRFKDYEADQGFAVLS